jgi:hypothetical protein
MGMQRERRRWNEEHVNPRRMERGGSVRGETMDEGK